MFGMKQNGKLSITIEKNKYFRRILKSAVIGSQDDLETIFLLYEPLINKFSTVDGHFDEDLHQYLLICIAQSIFKFRIQLFRRS